MQQKIVVVNESTKRQLIRFIEHIDFKKPFEFKFKPFRVRRSLSANALYWKWITILTDHLNSRGAKYTKEFLHMAMKHLFLGYQDMPDSGLNIPKQLKSTAKLNSKEFCEYMINVEFWALDHGCLLPRPEDSVYDQYLKAKR